MSQIMSFEDAIKVSGNNTRSVLLGNGFSIAQAGAQFSYGSLLDYSELPHDDPIRQVFNVLETFNFERVMEALEDASQIEAAYGDNDRAKRFRDDAARVREALITAVHTVHPGVRFDIPQAQRDACAAFLKRFEAIFTLNYDLLLYWVILHGASDKFSDGFGLGDKVDGFRTFDLGARCCTYYLHGALHLFLSPELETQKRVLTENTIIEDIAATIRQRSQLPLFVAEGTTTQKIARIRSIPYLTRCYEQLSDVRGSLYILGHAASDNDAHIYDAICYSGAEMVFVFVHNPEENLDAMREQLARYTARREDIKWLYVDAATAKVWG